MVFAIGQDAAAGGLDGGSEPPAELTESGAIEPAAKGQHFRAFHHHDQKTIGKSVGHIGAGQRRCGPPVLGPPSEAIWSYCMGEFSLRQVADLAAKPVPGQPAQQFDRIGVSGFVAEAVMPGLLRQQPRQATTRRHRTAGNASCCW